MNGLFDLIAELVAGYIASRPAHEPEVLSEQCETAMLGEVRSCLDRWKGGRDGPAVSGLSLQACSEILAWAKEKNDYYVYRFLLCELDADPAFGMERAAQQVGSFESCNSNSDETGICILPKVRGPKTTHLLASGEMQEEERRTRKNAHTWSDSLNELNNFYYLTQEERKGYRVYNYVCDPMLGAPVKELKIGLSPVMNQPLEAVFEYDDNVMEKDGQGHEFQHFEVLGIKPQEEIQTRVEASIKAAAKEQVDLLMLPEMFGTDALYELDEYGFNPLLRRACKQFPGDMPKLIVAPSRWHANQNYVHVYDSSGRRLCEQYKQHRYVFHGKNGKCREHLIDPPKQISLIHVPGWGRIAIAICMDFLHPEYLDFLVTKLKADILLCPSYSSGEYNFLQSVDAYSKYGTYAVWLNSCSALQRGGAEAPATVPQIVGAASAPVVSSQSRICRLVPACTGACRAGCLFVVTLPLDCAGVSAYEGTGVQVRHVLP